MQILRNKQLINFDGILYENGGYLSYSQGVKIKIDEKAKYIVPGFIDRHTHGGYGVDYMDGDIEGNEKLLDLLPSEGITTVLPTTLTQSEDKINESVNNVLLANSMTKHNNIHLEGPYLSLDKIGAQNPEYIQMPNTRLIDNLPDNIKMVSYAPELDENYKFLKYLASKNIVGSIVHSNSLASELVEHNKRGLKNFSHFYNGSSGYTHRSPGVVNAGLGLDYVFLELICDGHHIDPFVVKTTYKLKGIDSIVLITDSMRAKGLQDGEYDLGGQTVVLSNGTVRLQSGSLAGSVLKMNEAVRNFHNYTNCPLGEAFYAASTNVALSLGLMDIGKLEEGLKADIVVLDENLNVLQTFIEGQKVFDNKERSDEETEYFTNNE